MLPVDLAVSSLMRLVSSVASSWVMRRIAS